MPLVLKLSRKVYEALGDDVTNELVDWFNELSAKREAESKEPPDNSGRFESALGSIRVKLMEWMFIYWIGTVLAILAFLLLALSFSS